MNITAAPPIIPEPPVIGWNSPLPKSESPVIAVSGGARRRRFPFWCLVPLAFLLLPLLLAGGIASYFFLGSDTAALRDGVMQSVPGKWDKKLALNVGFMTMGLVRAGSGFVNLPPEARAGIEAIRGGEVGIYRVRRALTPEDHSAALASADAIMTRRGWTRAVGVLQQGNLVGVYLPPEGVSGDRIKCCVMFMNGNELVLVSAKANPAPLMEMIQNEIDLDSGRFQLGEL